MEEFKHELFEDEDNRSVVLRLPKTTDEQKRKELLMEHLGIVSNIVNEYIPDFEGKITNVIRAKEVYSPLYLDNGGIAALVVTENGRISLVIYSPIDFSVTRIQYLKNDIEISNHYLNKTPKGNLLVRLSKSTPLNISTIYYCNQEGDVLWTKCYEPYHFVIFILNNDAVILNNDAVIMRSRSNFLIKDADSEIKIDTSSYVCNLNSYGMCIIPYGKKGFICYNTGSIYLYTDDLVEKCIAVGEYHINMVELIDENYLIFISGTRIVLVDLITFSWKVMNLDNGMRVNHIHHLGDQLCLLLVEYPDSSYGVLFYDIKKARIYPNKNFPKTNNMMDYVGKLTNNRILLFCAPEATFTVYNIATDEITRHTINGYYHIFNISPTDSILTTDGRGDIVIYN